MKIAFPTDDGLMIAEEFNQAKGFLILTVELGEIEQQEMRWNTSIDPLQNGFGSFANLDGCDILIVREIPENSRDFLTGKGIEVNRTNELIITKSIIKFIDSSLREKANSCCCP